MLLLLVLKKHRAKSSSLRSNTGDHENANSKTFDDWLLAKLKVKKAEKEKFKRIQEKEQLAHAEQIEEAKKEKSERTLERKKNDNNEWMKDYTKYEKNIISDKNNIKCTF